MHRLPIDASVLIDLLANGPNADAAEACLRQALSNGPVVVSDVAQAKSAAHCATAPRRWRCSKR